MTELFVKKLGALEGPAKAAISKMLASSEEPASIRTRLRSAGEAARRDPARRSTRRSRPKIDLRFETAPDLVSGIELVAGGQKLAWSISDYLKTLEKSVERAPDSRTSRRGGAA